MRLKSLREEVGQVVVDFSDVGENKEDIENVMSVIGKERMMRKRDSRPKKL
jgi:hypothetical protein